MSINEAKASVIAYFLTEFPVNSPRSLTETVVRQHLLQTYSAEFTDQFVIGHLDVVKSRLVEEFNERHGSGVTLRFRIEDVEGSQVSGNRRLTPGERLAFQDAINGISHSEFEGLAAHVLKVFGCQRVWRTPESHDQGIDAFGYLDLVVRTARDWQGGPPRVAFLGQAKHYRETRVGSKDIRDFVGARDLALHKIYSIVDDRYPDLELLPFAPIALVFLTTEEVPMTVKRLARRSGIFVLSSDDLWELLVSAIRDRPARIDRAWIARKLRQICYQAPVAATGRRPA